MNRYFVTFALLITCRVIFAQVSNIDQARDADHAALRSLGAQCQEAINKGDLRPLASLVSPQATAVFATNDEVQGLDAMQSYYDSIRKNLGKGSSYTVQLKPERSELFGDVALARGVSDETAILANGRAFNFATHWTAVLVKEDAVWKIHRLHVSMNPIDNPIVTWRLRFRTWCLAAATIAGVILAYFWGRARGKRAMFQTKVS